VPRAVDPFPDGLVQTRHHVAWGIDWFVRVAPGKKRGRREALMPRAQIKDEQTHRHLRVAELVEALRDR
jgi:hypothetical protein